MERVLIEVNELLSIVKKNRELHIAEFEEAKTDYIVMCRKKLKEQTKVYDKMTSDALRQLSLSIGIPQSHEKEYNSVIRQLELTVDKNVSLTQIEFSNYVEDDWAWKAAFTTSNALYKSA